MSVLVPDMKVFQYVHAGILKAAYNSTIDSFYSYSVVKHFKGCVDFEAEADRIIKSWMNLNEFSYNVRYKEESKTLLSEFFTSSFVNLNPFQLLKYLECLNYNIEISPELFKADLQLLKAFTIEITSAIVSNMPEYKAAKWSE